MARRPIIQFVIITREDQEKRDKPFSTREIEEYLKTRSNITIEEVFVSLRDLSDARALEIVKRLIKKL